MKNFTNLAVLSYLGKGLRCAAALWIKADETAQEGGQGRLRRLGRLSWLRPLSAPPTGSASFGSASAASRAWRSGTFVAATAVLVGAQLALQAAGPTERTHGANAALRVEWTGRTGPPPGPTEPTGPTGLTGQGSWKG